jgi:cytochrome oxidase Cu insertion factor (SCO1/SenC/PrrC family)
MDARRFALIFAASAVAVAAAATLALLLLAPSREGGGRGAALIGGPFELVDHEGRTVREEDFRGKLMLVYFGYTWCPDVCPTELQTMSAALDLLGKDAAAVAPIFITVDPERDTPEVMADYRGHFHPSFVALTGTKEQVAAAAKAWRVFYAKAKSERPDEYLMDHSSFVYLMDRKGGYLTHFAPSAAPEAMAARIREHL